VNNLEWGLANLAVPYLTAMIRPDNERSIGVAPRRGGGEPPKV